MNAQTHWAMTQIQRYLAEGNAAAVVEIGERIVAHEDKNIEGYLAGAFCLALGYEQLGHLTQALRWIEQCLSLDPANPTLRAGLGRVLIKMGRNQPAAAVFETLARQYPDRADYHQAAGSARLRLGELEAALRHLRRAHQIAPSNPCVLNDLAATCLLRGDLESALDLLTQASRIAGPQDAALARDIRESLEEVKAALELRERAAGPQASAQVIDLYAKTAGHAADDGGLVAEEPPAECAAADGEIRRLLIESMAQQGCRPRQIQAAVRLWSDFLTELPEARRAATEQRPRVWAAALLYTIGRLDEAPRAIQSKVAACFGVSISALSRRFCRLRRTLALEIGDPRYSTAASARRRRVLEQIHAGQTDGSRLFL